MNETVLDQVLALVSDALADIEQRRVPLSAAIQKGTRIARLRSDWDALWWLSFELLTLGDKEAGTRLAQELLPHYSREAYRKQNEVFVNAWKEERTVGRDAMADEGSPESRGSVNLDSVLELEARIETLEYMRALPVPPRLSPLDLAVFSKETTTIGIDATNRLRTVKCILVRISQRVHDCLSLAEKQLLYGQIHADIFERNRRYVDERLTAVVPEAAEQFIAAYSRAADGSVESRAHALTSCRRVLKTMADKLYPAREPLRGPDGKERILDDAKYVNRLWQYVHETVGGATAGGTMKAQISDLGNRIDSLQDLSSKGVHADVSEFEANMCVIQTYLLVGDLLRIQDRFSAVSIDPPVEL